MRDGRERRMRGLRKRDGFLVDGMGYTNNAYRRQKHQLPKLYPPPKTSLLQNL